MKRTRKKVGQYKVKDKNINKLIYTYGLCGSINFINTNSDIVIEKKQEHSWGYQDLKRFYYHYKKKYIKQYKVLNSYHKKCIVTSVKQHIPKYFCPICNDFSDYRLYDYSAFKVDCKQCLTKRNNDWIKKKRITDDSFRFIMSARQLIYLSLKNKGYKKGSKSEQMLGCEWDFFREYIERQFQSGMSWNNYGKWHLDHIYPISKATSYEMALELNHYTNFQPLWAFDNISKNNKVVEHQRKLAL